MEPNIKSGDICFYSKFNTLKRFDIISIYPPIETSSNPYVRRVIAFPGETVEIKNGVLFINNNIVNKTFKAKRDNIIDIKPVKVPMGKIYVLGDNRLSSLDSEDLGSFNINDINGKLVYTVDENNSNNYSSIIRLILFIT